MTRRVVERERIKRERLLFKILIISDSFILAVIPLTHSLTSMTKSIFYSSVGLIYLFAFSSLYVQFPGLLGHNGVLPVDSFMSRVLSHGMSFMEFPSLVMFAQSVKVPEDCLCDFLMLLGIVSSVIIVIGFPNPLLFSLCWLCYLSVYLVGQTFLSFQWDILLLEVSRVFCLTFLCS